MTSSGKTHSMIGISELGLVYLVLKDLLVQGEITVNYLEVYNEQVRDLLSSSENSLPVLEDPALGVVVPDLISSSASDLATLTRIIELGNNKRTMAPTKANDFSTRSHAIIIFNLKNKAKLSLIDLAGSERACVTENFGKRMKEGASINKSLLALGTCINLLSDPLHKGKYVPYRNSKLTRLLKDSLGGNTLTVMLACLSPAIQFKEETLNTLKYANRAQAIRKNVVVTPCKKYRMKKIECLKTLPQELANQIMENFEEHWELKNSIKEIEQLNQNNYKEIKTLLLKGLCTDNCKKDIQENEDTKKELLKKLQDNHKNKLVLQNALASMKTSEETKLRNELQDIKLEKIDLCLKNEQIKKEAEQAKRESREKDKLIKEMRDELDLIKEKKPASSVILHSLSELRSQKKMNSPRVTSESPKTVSFLKSFVPQSPPSMKTKRVKSSKVVSRMKSERNTEKKTIPSVTLSLFAKKT